MNTNISDLKKYLFKTERELEKHCKAVENMKIDRHFDSELKILINYMKIHLDEIDKLLISKDVYK